MCGIVGVLRTGEHPLPPPDVVRRMLAAIQHRGPDGNGEFRDQDVHLGAVRLAILDIEHGGQPTFGCSKRAVCVYNGEIYNYRSIARELNGHGHQLQSRSDSAVLPHLYEERGDKMVDALRGMFAFALWDRDDRRLLLARDRMGIKPLYVARTPHYLVFASELKAIVASGLIEPEIDRDSLDDLFSLSYPCPPRTLLRGVEELRPAHILGVRAGQAPKAATRYWRAPFVAAGEHSRISRREAEAGLRERLEASVERHLQADTPIATFLSGGIDSSAITALVNQVSDVPPTTFSIHFSDARYSEGELSTRTAQHLGCPNVSVTCGPETAEAYPDVVWATELPLQFPLALPLARLSRAARDAGFPVVLTGEGSDEIFGGYDCFRADRMRRLLEHKLLRPLRPALYKKLYGWLGSPTSVTDFMLASHATPRADLAKRFGGVVPPWYDVWTMLDLERSDLLAPGGRRVRPIEEPPAELLALVRDDVADLHPLDAALAFEMETRLPSWILPIGDRASMLNGVEARVPFLDDEIVEWVAPLHPRLKMRGLTEKALLRGAVSDLLPKDVRQRRKRPFYTPIRGWFFDAQRPAYVDEVLSSEAIRKAGMFDPRVVARLRAGLELASDPFMQMRLEWMLLLVLGCQLFHESFVQKLGPRAHRSGPAA